MEVILSGGSLESAAITFLTIDEKFAKCGKNYTVLWLFGHTEECAESKGFMR